MRLARLFAALCLLSATAVRAAPVATYTLTVEAGYAGPVEFDFGEDVSTATGTWTVYSLAPTGGAGGTVLFTYSLEAGSTSTRLRCTVTGTDTLVPGSYYMRGVREMGGITQPWHGTLQITGR